MMMCDLDDLPEIPTKLFAPRPPPAPPDEASQRKLDRAIEKLEPPSYAPPRHFKRLSSVTCEKPVAVRRQSEPTKNHQSPRRQTNAAAAQYSLTRTTSRADRPKALVTCSGIPHLCRVISVGSKVTGDLAEGSLGDAIVIVETADQQLKEDGALIILNDVDLAGKELSVPAVAAEKEDVEFFKTEDWVSITVENRVDSAARRRAYQKNREGPESLEFLAACHRGHVAALELFKDIDHWKLRDLKGRTGLMLAAMQGRVDMILALAGDKPAFVDQVIARNSPQEDEKSRRRTSLSMTRDEATDEYKTYILEKDHEGRTALVHAVLSGKVDAVEALLKPPISANARENKGAPLELAIARGFTDVAVILLKNGAWRRGDEKNVATRKVYEQAIDKDMDTVVDVLYSQQVKTSSDGDDGHIPGAALLYSIKKRNRKCVDELLKPRPTQRGTSIRLCNANFSDSSKVTPLIEAASQGDADLVHKLMNYVFGWEDPWLGGFQVVHVNAADAQGRTALMIACDRGFLNVVKVLCGSVSQWNDYSDIRRSPRVRRASIFFPAEEDKKMRDTKHIIDADVKNTEEQDRCALHYAAHSSFEQPDIVRLLCVQAKATRTVVDSKKRTALHLACDRENVQIVQELLIRNASVTAKDEDGNTPLHAAVRLGATGIAAMLIARGARPNEHNNFGDTPLHIGLLLYHTVDLGYHLHDDSCLEEVSGHHFLGVVEHLIQCDGDLQCRNQVCILSSAT